VTVAIGIFLFIFGSFGTWLLATRFPRAYFLRTGYVFMALGGACGALWGARQSIDFGIVAVAMLFIGGLLGVIGALRREVRVTPRA
jgi:hypothetical protein